MYLSFSKMQFDLDNAIYNIVANSDERAFRQLFDHYFPGAFSFAHSIVKDKPAAREIVADVFVKLWEKKQDLAGIGNFPAYLYTAVKNSCLTFIKKKPGFVLEDAGEAFIYDHTPETTLVRQENLKKIAAAVNTLPPRCRLIFRLIKDEGLKYNEVAQLLNISERTVNAQLTIAIARIATALKKDLPEFSVYYGKKKSG